MSQAKALEIEKQSLWEKLDALTAAVEEHADRLIVGDDAYEHARALKAEIDRIEHEKKLELYRQAVRISRRNRGETP